MAPDTKWARDAVAVALKPLNFVEPWLFEDAPASSQPVVAGYLDRVRTSDLVIWLIEPTTTAAVRTEIETALQAGRRVLMFRISADPSDPSTEALVERTGGRYVRVTGADDLKRKLLASLDDEVMRSWRASGPPSHSALLDRLRSQSRIRCIDRWLAAGVSSAVADKMASDLATGLLAVPLFDRSRFVILRGEIGSGKSLAAERVFQSAVERSREAETEGVPAFIEARTIQRSLEAHLRDNGFVDVTRDPTLVVVDGLDEADPSRRIDLARQARRLVLTYPSLRVLVTSRPIPELNSEFTSSFVDVPPLTREESAALMSRVAETTIHLFDDSESYLEAVLRPLFAILVGVTQRDRSFSLLPRGQLLSRLVELSLGRVSAHRESADPLLRRLARLTVDRGGQAVPLEEVAPYSEVAPLLQSRLVVERDGCLRFSLSILAEWFAARELELHAESGTGIAQDPERLDRWLIPLQICIATSGRSTVSRLMEPLASTRPAKAAKVLDETFPEWGTSAEARHLPSWRECGKQLRGAMQGWTDGLGPVRDHIAPIGPKGRLRTVGVRRHDPSTLTVSWARQQASPGVVQLPRDYDKEIEWSSWTRKLGINAHSAWAWQWTREYLDHHLVQLIRHRGLPPTESLLPELIWRLAVRVMSPRDWWTSEPIERRKLLVRLSEIPALSSIRDDAVPNTYVAVRDVVQAISETAPSQITPPWAGPEGVPGPYLWNGYSATSLVERTQAVYMAAVKAYGDSVARWFPKFGNDMRLARRSPFRMIGVVRESDGSPDWFGGRVLDYYVEPCPDSAESTVEFRLANKETWDAFRRDVDDKFNRGEIDNSSSSVLDVFGLDAAEKLTYTWLETDLRDLGWMR